MMFLNFYLTAALKKQFKVFCGLFAMFAYKNIYLKWFRTIVKNDEQICLKNKQ